VVDLNTAGSASAAEEHDSVSTWSSLRLLATDHRDAIFGLSVTAVLSGIAEAGILAVIAQVAAALLADSGHVAVDAGPVNLELSIANLLVLAAVLAIVRTVLQAGGALLQARLAADVQADLRNDLFTAFTRASWSVQASDREGHLQEMLTSQAFQATAGTLQLAALISSLLTFVVLVLSAMVLNFVAAAVVLGSAVLLFGALRPLSTSGRHSAKELSKSQLNFAGGIGEAVRMSEETHVFGVNDVQRARIAELVGVAHHLFVRVQFIGRFVPQLFQSLIYLIVIGGLAFLYATGTGDGGALGAVILMMVRAGSYGQQVQSSYQAIVQTLPFTERLHDATVHYRGEEHALGERRLEEISTLAFSDVSYSYPSREPALSGIGFETCRGEAVGIIGPSGAGKSTLVQLLLQLREPSHGSYSINGLPASGFRAADWHRQVAYVPQEPQLLHASVADNIRYFREDIEDAMVERAARLARIDDDIRGWSQGYETLIGPRADSVSGGQRQRICLARALAANPQMLVLDEPTSALDPHSEALIQVSLKELADSMTLFVVTHRMSLLAVCDRVLVILDGRVDGFGQAQALRETNAYFSAA
jgi:ABC-type multidrug transport system fused ATPase/permease subunit